MQDLSAQHTEKSWQLLTSTADNSRQATCGIHFYSLLPLVVDALNRHFDSGLFSIACGTDSKSEWRQIMPREQARHMQAPQHRRALLRMAVADSATDRCFAAGIL